jgi:CDP-6-deoxy-D-xylo-4-hexulose-3-dehydrase
MIKLVSDTIDKNDISSLVEWLTKGEIPILTKNSLTIELEKKWAKKMGTKYSVFVNSGSSAILLGLTALLFSRKLKNKKIVIPSLSWATDVSSPIILGMEPLMCDCNLEDLSCDLVHLEKIFSEHSPSVFILVSALGFVPKMDKIVDLCNEYDVILLEDVCESMGSKFENTYLGNFGFASFFSLYFGHHISTIEGGFINTNDEDFYYSLIMMRSHGWDRDLPQVKQKELREKFNVDDFSSLYNFYLPGFNLRSTDLQAFLGLRAIDKLDNFSKKRNENLQIYLNNLKENMLDLKFETNTFNSNFAFPVLSEKRDKIVKSLIQNHIEVRPLIAGDMSKKPMWYNLYDKVNLKNSEKIDKFGFYLPNHQDLEYDDIIKICSIIKNV